MTPEVTPLAELTFGEALGELEGIVRALESGELELEESLERYERGVALLRACRERLAGAEQRVTMLIGELESNEDGPAAQAGTGGTGDE